MLYRLTEPLVADLLVVARAFLLRRLAGHDADAGRLAAAHRLPALPGASCWVYKHNPASTTWDDAEGAPAEDDTDESESWESFVSPELAYVHTTLMDAMASLRDPRTH